MTLPRPLPFTKMQGLGNDFVVVESIRSSLLPEIVTPKAYSGLAGAICDRRFGVGADGLILLVRGERAAHRMIILNADGSEAEMCGNGLRCAAQLLKIRGIADSDSVDVETGAGVLRVDFVADGLVRVDAGPVSCLRGSIGMPGPPDEEFIECEVTPKVRGTVVSVGNPHLVVFVDDVDGVDLEAIGPELENHPFFPNRINVHFVTVLDRQHLRQRTWERGAGITLACGTGACAVGVAGFRTGRSDRAVDVRLPGGHLAIRYLENDHAEMTGPAVVVYEGEITAERLLTSALAV